MGALDLVDWPPDRTLALTSQAGSLRFPIALRNASAVAVRIGEVSFDPSRPAGGAAPLRLDPAPLRLTVAANQIARANIRLQLDPATPPGRYQGELRLAGLVRPVRIDVVQRVDVTVRPQPLVIDAALGREQGFAVAFENRGNVPIVIDLVGRYPLGEEIPLSPKRAARPARGLARLGEIVDRALGGRDDVDLVEVGAVEISMPGGPADLAPGASRTEKVSIALPETLSPLARYHVFAPLYGADLHLVIVTATKTRVPARRGRRISPAKTIPAAKAVPAAKAARRAGTTGKTRARQGDAG